MAFFCGYNHVVKNALFKANLLKNMAFYQNVSRETIA